MNQNQTNIEFTEQIAQQINELSDKFQILQNELSNVVVGQKEAIKFSILSLLTYGHILLEGVPGVAKTTLVKNLARCVGVDFSRIQFMPDMIPSDVVGSVIYNQQNLSIEVKKGPIF